MTITMSGTKTRYVHSGAVMPIAIAQAVRLRYANQLDGDRCDQHHRYGRMVRRVAADRVDHADTEPPGLLTGEQRGGPQRERRNAFAIETRRGHATSKSRDQHRRKHARERDHLACESKGRDRDQHHGQDAKGAVHDDRCCGFNAADVETREAVGAVDVSRQTWQERAYERTDEKDPEDGGEGGTRARRQRRQQHHPAVRHQPAVDQHQRDGRGHKPPVSRSSRAQDLRRISAPQDVGRQTDGNGDRRPALSEREARVEGPVPSEPEGGVEGPASSEPSVIGPVRRRAASPDDAPVHASGRRRVSGTSRRE